MTVIYRDWQDRPARSTRTRPAMRPIRARYDAAVLDADNARHWANADALSARQANSIEVRERLRNHARYEVANNCYARGIVDTVANITIGYGPTLTFQPSEVSELAQRETARLFNTWAEEINLWGKLWTLSVSRVQDGEAFALFRTNPRLHSAVELDLQLLEAEQITDGPTARDWYDPKRVDGIDTDDLGNPIRYYVLREHPGDGATFRNDPIGVSVEQIIHWYRVQRPGQLRGVPEITPALPLFAQLRRYTLAVLTAAETAADFAAVIKSGIVPDPDDVQTDPFETIDITRGMFTTLPDGYDISQLKAEQPTTTYGDFKRELLAEIGRCLQLPKLISLMDASGYNYSSGRLDKQATDRAIEVDRYQCELVVLSKIYAAWFSEAARIPGYLPAEIEAGADLRPNWLWRELGHVDRQKEATGAAQELANHTTTLAEECARNGRDWEQVLRQRSRELQLMREMELTTAAQPQTQEAAEPQGEEDDQEQEV